MWNIGLNANTKIYGIIPLKLGNIEAIRHKITPEVSFTYQPNFIETEINDTDPLINSFHQSTSSGYSRATFRLSNLFQAKIKTKDNIYEKRDILTWDMIVSYNPNNQDSGENNLSNLNSYFFACELIFLKSRFIFFVGGEILRWGFIFNTTVMSKYITYKFLKHRTT